MCRRGLWDRSRAGRQGWRDLTVCGLRRIVLIILCIRRQRQPPGIMAAGEFHQRLDPGIYRRMGRKQVGETLARVIDA